MALGQLYYTSCRTGITGFPGYQFNAVTPGIPVDVMRDVEALTAYEPPHSLSAAAADRTRYPVNLCHLPGETTVLACVEFVGEDYSRRSGNYFAHALVTADADRDLDGRLPIELWRSPEWVTEPVEQVDLPELRRAPVAGPLNPDVVADFLAGSGSDHHLAAMLTAAEAAVDREERKLVIIAADSDTVAHWVAALSYLLPAGLARRMSFMTYSRQPRYSRTAVVGALPEVDIERTATGFDSYYLFDLDADRASELTVHPLARLLADVGPVHAEELWERVARHATGDESTFDQLYPLAVAATVGWSAGPDRPRVAPLPLVAWLERRGSALETDLFAAVGDATATALRDSAEQLGAATVVDSLRTLARTAEALGVAELVSQAEVALAEVLVGGMPVPPDGLRLGTEAGRRVAADRLDGRLAELPAEGVFAYLRWASEAGLRLHHGALKRAGTAIAGPALLSGDRSAAFEAMRTSPAVRQGVVEYLDEVAERDPEAVTVLLVTESGRLGLDAGESEACPALTEAAIVAGVRAGRRTPIDALAEVAALRNGRGQQPVIGVDLLDRIWPTPDWNGEQALEVLDRLGEKDLADPGVLGRLETAVMRQPRLADRSAYLVHGQLCYRLERSPAFPSLPAAAQRRIRELLDAGRLVRELLKARGPDEFDDAVDGLRDRIAGAPTSVRAQRIEDELLRQYQQLGFRNLLRAVSVLTGFRRGLVAMLAEEAARSTDVPAALLLWRLRCELASRDGKPAATALHDVDEAVLPILKRWRRRDIHRLQEQLADQNAHRAAMALGAWIDGDGMSTVRKIMRVLSHRPGSGRSGDGKKK